MPRPPLKGMRILNLLNSYIKLKQINGASGTDGSVVVRVVR